MFFDKIVDLLGSFVGFLDVDVSPFCDAAFFSLLIDSVMADLATPSSVFDVLNILFGQENGPAVESFLLGGFLNDILIYFDSFPGSISNILISIVECEGQTDDVQRFVNDRLIYLSDQPIEFFGIVEHCVNRGCDLSIDSFALVDHLCGCDNSTAICIFGIFRYWFDHHDYEMIVPFTRQTLEHHLCDDMDDDKLISICDLIQSIGRHHSSNDIIDTGLEHYMMDFYSHLSFEVKCHALEALLIIFEHSPVSLLESGFLDVLMDQLDCNMLKQILRSILYITIRCFEGSDCELIRDQVVVSNIFEAIENVDVDGSDLETSALKARVLEFGSRLL
jgi:hypothetical protein